MITHRIFDDYSEEDFSLFAIHSNVEDHAMAFALNQALKLKLKRSRSDYDLNNLVSFPCFEWKDEVQDLNWHLLCNSGVSSGSQQMGNLFPDELTVNRHYLIPEFKDADYILRMELGMHEQAAVISNKILAISHVITAYSINTEKLKSKENLIF
ncbi:IPExxxVDY family protein [Lentiprolixibacter aurantiacus]|uniref:IPExxxVDY family protein n=1 Tax=Lentiprolixibacter aurantiacus TaxID=2993939 RepID=A0AAE3MJ46_9FLAO|nr:IPExxxVDY family protein [Lentiprolixibacter aurantiacus]MCX2718384.1 IPExxxVDY family protein [Lentiprolixibacter aurantiacus]